MPSVSWNANAQAEYWIDVALNGQRLEVLVDTGLLDALGQVGFSVDAATYDSFKHLGRFHSFQVHRRLSADGTLALTESGSLDAQLYCVQTQISVGPIVSIRVLRGAPGVPDRVGVAFFHQLKGCTVVWDLDQRTWRIEYP
jgi:hypothetical protein